MIKRKITSFVKEAAHQYPVVTITGPRQSGKTTLCKTSFPQYAYISLENPENREFALEDPKGFLRQYAAPIILDEIQNTPDIVSYIQGIVDETQENGRYILTGSQNFALTHTVAQSLAGRTAVFKLLPFTLSEISKQLKSKPIDDILLTGFYPRIYDQNLVPHQALGFYIETYLERDIRSLSYIKDLTLFQKFLKICAGRCGQLLNLSSIGNEIGISHTTAREWLSLLEASYIIFLLKPHHKNYNKRIIKAPKLYFYDVGLAAYLLGIKTVEQMQRDPLRGNLFENLVIAEVVKEAHHQGQSPQVAFFRDKHGNEVDLIVEHREGLVAIEVKSAETISSSFFKGLNYFEKLSGEDIFQKCLIYGGQKNVRRSKTEIMSLRQIRWDLIL